MASFPAKTEELELPDAALVRHAKAGRMEAFEHLVTRHERRVYSLALRITGSAHDAEDVTQQTFLNAMRNLERFREASAFTTWLIRIAANAALKVVRKRTGLPTVSLDELDEANPGALLPRPEYIAEWKETPDVIAQRKETRKTLDAAIAGLEPGYRAVFLLRDVEGLSVKETAAALGLGEANVKVRLLRARLQLRERLTRTLGDPARRYVPGDHAHE
jgi:RNA polymerase sigma-70 factor, ECF subfamily